MSFKNREGAGKQLAEKLRELKGSQNLVVLAIPRGGLVIGKQLALVLNCPLDVLVTKKIGAPDNPELAIGAVGTMGEPVLNEALIKRLNINKEYLEEEIESKRIEVERRIKAYRGEKTLFRLKGKTVILTDDGVATGATMLAAIEVVRQQEPKKIIVAIPVVSRDSLQALETKADRVVYLETPLMFFAVGQFYQEFNQVSDEEVKELLK